MVDVVFPFYDVFYFIFYLLVINNLVLSYNDFFDKAHCWRRTPNIFTQCVFNHFNSD